MRALARDEIEQILEAIGNVRRNSPSAYLPCWCPLPSPPPEAHHSEYCLRAFDVYTTLKRRLGMPVPESGEYRELLKRIEAIEARLEAK